MFIVLSLAVLRVCYHYYIDLVALTLVNKLEAVGYLEDVMFYIIFCQCIYE
jgi:hypothetical protein